MAAGRLDIDVFPFELSGDEDALMALNDADAKELLTKVRDIHKALPQLLKGANAAINFAHEGHRQLGVTDGKHTGEDGRLIPAGLPLSFIDYNVQKFGPA
jgi:hypothetical protein